MHVINQPRSGHTEILDRSSDAPEEKYWVRELSSFRDFLTANPGSDYRGWNPTKWQSLQRVCAELNTLAGDPRAHSALELGCGSATLLIQMSAVGWRCVGVDIARSALALAEASARSLGLAGPDLLHADFEALSPARHGADLVLSVGVIEHFPEEGQERLVRWHCQLSRRWVLIGVPNLESPIFQSFIEWARRSGRLYDEEHYDSAMRKIAERLRLKLLVEDGCHLFLSRAEYYIEGNPELDAFYRRLRGRLVELGGDRYAAFPRMDLGVGDIDVLSRAEAEASPDERRRFGFLNYYLLEVG